MPVKKKLTDGEKICSRKRTRARILTRHSASERTRTMMTYAMNTWAIERRASALGGAARCCLWNEAAHGGAGKMIAAIDRLRRAHCA